MFVEDLAEQLSVSEKHGKTFGMMFEEHKKLLMLSMAGNQNEAPKSGAAAPQVAPESPAGAPAAPASSSAAPQVPGTGAHAQRTSLAAKIDTILDFAWHCIPFGKKEERFWKHFFNSVQNLAKETTHDELRRAEFPDRQEAWLELKGQVRGGRENKLING